MEQHEIYIILFGIIVIVGQLFQKSSIPTSLLLVITGMLLNLVPSFPHIDFDSSTILHVFLPLLVYQISSFSSWKDVRKNIRPIALLSIGHVIFITFLVAIIIHAFIPEFNWPMAFILGAVISPPDSVAIVSIAEKIRMPSRIVTILEGEGMLNDAAALILFRFALIALVTHQFSAIHAISAFFIIVIGETTYGLILGYLIGKLRQKIHNSMLHIIASILTPFLAYIPAEKLGGSGILATVVTGFIIGNYYALRFTPEFRLVSRTVWPALTFVIQSILFLMLGLDMGLILARMSSIPLNTLLLYSCVVILTVIIGRFIWVYLEVYLPRLIDKRQPRLPWQYPFIISWSGMRGVISLAAALAVPAMYPVTGGINLKDLLIFLVFSVITATLLLQGLTLPWILKITKIYEYGRREKYREHLTELSTRMKMVRAVIRWLNKYKKEMKDNPRLLDEINLYLKEYHMLKVRLKERIVEHDDKSIEHDEVKETSDETLLPSQLIEVEREELLRLWHEDKINLTIRNKLLDRLDHRFKYLPI